MGGRGTGGGPYRIKADQVADRLREAEQAARTGQTDAEVNAILNRRLIEINRRNNEEVAERLDQIQAALADQIEGVDRLLFGGSVAKQTYVEGLSDVDSLLVLKAGPYGELPPSEVIAKLKSALDARLTTAELVAVRPGEMAVTVGYRDGLEVQLLPAVERPDGLSIKAAGGDRWTAIDPQAFADRLSKVNQSQAGAVVPAIKLAKAILAGEPKSRRPSGYHLEALALAAFEGYEGPRNPKAMLTHLFESAAKNVKRPIVDLTGQSEHVDESLGKASSQKRRWLSEALKITAKRMKTAPSAEAWRALLGD